MNHNGSECFGKYENLFSLQKFEPWFLIKPMHSPVTLLTMVPHLPYSNSDKTVTQYDLNTCRTGCLGTMIVEFMTYLKHHGFIPPPQRNYDKNQFTVLWLYVPTFCLLHNITHFFFVMPGQMDIPMNLPDSISFLGGPHRRFRCGGVL